MSAEGTPRSTPTNSPPQGAAARASAKPKLVKCPDLFNYLKTLPAKTLERLYLSPAACLAVLRELPPLGQQIVFRLLFLDKAVTKTAISAWVSKEFQHELEAACDALDALGVWYNASGHSTVFAYILLDTFRLNLRVALFGGGQPWTIEPKSETDPKKTRDIAFLDRYANDRWDCLLHFMVGVTQPGSGGGGGGGGGAGAGDTSISQDSKQVLLHAGLMRPDEGDVPVITSAGFQFLLMQRSEQVWYFLTQYLETVDERLSCDVPMCLGFLCQLSFATLGQCYSSDRLADELQQFLQHLREFGLVYQRKRKEGIFYPTRLALSVASGLKNRSAVSAGGAESSEAGFIIVETNYRIYAYTDSELPISLLALFSEPLHRFPGMVVALLTRDSVRQALKSGITASQIIDFLRMNAHPEMHKKALATGAPTVVPPTICDQVHLWERERDRISFTEGIAYSQFLSTSDFEMIRDFARDRGYSLWDGDQKKTIVVSKEAHDDVRRFYRKMSKTGQ